MRKLVGIILAAVLLLSLSAAGLGASQNAYDFEQALKQVTDEVKNLEIGFFTKISLRLKINNALTYSSQLYPGDLFDPEEIIQVMREAVRYGKDAAEITSAVFAVDMARKMKLTEEQVKLVKQVMATGLGNMKEGGIPQEFLDTVATYGEYKVPPCCL